MEQLDQITNMIAFTMGIAWASGINLYATIFMLGILGVTGNISLPPDLLILTNPMVIVAAGFMYCVEFFTDKIPSVDTGWDTLHTFVRIPAGAILAVGAVAGVNPAISVAAALVGGGLAASTHATKSGTRVLINASPEPVFNWIISITEDIAVIAGLWAALHYPWIFLAFLAAFILLAIWLLPKLWRGIGNIFGFVGHLFGFWEKNRILDQGNQKNSSLKDIASQQVENKIERIESLHNLFKKKLITEEQYKNSKLRLLENL